MYKKANEFLKISGELYETNKIRWKKLVNDFDEDVYNETIVKVYDAILRGEDTDTDIVAYWFSSFKNNLKRNKGYKENEDKDELDKLNDRENDEEKINLYYSKIRFILLKVRENFDRKTFELFRMYLLCNMSFEQLDAISGVDSKEKIMRVRKWINDNKNFN